jgi:hypothetical protein
MVRAWRGVKPAMQRGASIAARMPAAAPDDHANGAEAE